MSDEKHNKATGEESEDDVVFADLAPADSASEQAETKFLDITIDRSTNELIVKEPKTGKAVRIAAKITETREEEFKPLTPDDFRTALKRVGDLGLTWTADRVPHVRPKESVSDEVLLSEEFENIQREYPGLPIELSSIVFHFLTDAHVPAELVGSQDDLEKKIAIVNELIITPEYKAEFFFRHAIKVPYLTDIDWEVVLKLAENNVKDPPGIPYALLSLRFLDPSRANARQQQRTFTVAVDGTLVKGLIANLMEVQDRLERARPLTEAMLKAQSASKGKDNADNTTSDKRRRLE
jgi:hypothetical protein